MHTATGPSARIMVCSIGQRMITDPHYLAIREFYGDRRAERSNVPYINHIDEGLTILKGINASLHAKRGFCLHPIFQADESFAVAFESGGLIERYEINHFAIALAVEYRAIANSYLSHHTISALDEIQLSPLTDVQDMLIADKIQNRKDFLLHHVDSHPRSNELSQYFLNWLTRLGVSEARYDELSALINDSSS